MRNLRFVSFVVVITLFTSIIFMVFKSENNQEMPAHMGGHTWCNENDDCANDERCRIVYGRQDGYCEKLADQCNDYNLCTIDTIGSYSCEYEQIPGCCRGNDECEQVSSTDGIVTLCEGRSYFFPGRCTTCTDYDGDEFCDAEFYNCDDGRDNDGDGTVDCCDEMCADDVDCAEATCPGECAVVWGWTDE